MKGYTMNIYYITSYLLAFTNFTIGIAFIFLIDDLRILNLMNVYLLLYLLTMFLTIIFNKLGQIKEFNNKYPTK